MAISSGLAILTFASTIAQTVGQLSESNQQASAEQYNAAVLRQEAQIADERGKLESQKIRRESGILRGTQKAVYSKAGVTLSGSAIDVINDSASQVEMDAMIAEYNAKIDKNRALSEANYREQRAKEIRRAGLFTAGTTLLTQTASFAAENFGNKNKRGTDLGPGTTSQGIKVPSRYIPRY